MSSRALLVVVTGLPIVIGCTQSNDSPCSGQIASCDPLPSTAPTIELTAGSALIASIETSGCAVAWSATVMSAANFPTARSTACPADSFDGGAGACVHYACVPKVDGGDGCTEASINTGAAHCSVTVIATTGEKNSFEVTLSAPSIHYYCQTAMGQCVENTLQEVSPQSVTLTFARPDASADSGGSSGPDAGVDLSQSSGADAGVDATEIGVGLCLGTPNVCMSGTTDFVEDCTNQTGCEFVPAPENKPGSCGGTPWPCSRFDQAARCRAQSGCRWSGDD
jgi:hypothetical protein